MNAPRRSVSTGLAAGVLALLFACTSSSGPGQLEIKLSGAQDPAAALAQDPAAYRARNPAVDQIVVNVTKVTAHSTSSGWITVGPVVSPTAVNLLDLQSSATTLGLTSLPPGKITQIRLVIARDGNYVVPAGSTAHEPLIVPSGMHSGIKILGPWEVPDCTRRIVTLEFDGKHSLEYHQVCGGSGTWILRPVIRLAHDASAAISCEPESPPPPPAPECSAEVACGTGQACDSGVCVDATPQPTGSACIDGSGCLTASCNDGVCAPGGAGAPCQSFRDCVSSQCIEGSCSGGAALGAGATCSANGDCLSGDCAGTCQPGLQGTLCVAQGDCLSGACVGGSCAPAM